MGFIASIVEAYGEFRVSKGRILLSLIGVAFSVFAMTGMLGAGGMLRSGIERRIERDRGRAVTLDVMSTGGGADPAVADQVVSDALARLGVQYSSRVLDSSLGIQTRSGVRQVMVRGVDPDYSEMYRLKVAEGRWLADNDGRRLTPAVVLDDKTWNSLGRPAPGTSVVTAYGPEKVPLTLLLVGVTPPRPGQDEMMGMQATVFVHPDAFEVLQSGSASSGVQPRYAVWVPEDNAEAVQVRLRQMLTDTPAGRFEVSSMGTGDLGFDQLQNAVIVAASVMLILGAMGLVNISLVTVRYRMREIGIRRSYGATGLRIFFGVLMESVVATTIAGIVGVAGAIALIRAPFVQDFFTEQGLVDLPPFPISAVITGLVAAILVGALAGLIPALIATRIKVIDAIRA